MKKFKIKTKNSLPDKIIGISSLHNDFQIAWSLNKILKINLTKTDDFFTDNKSSFSLFTFKDTEENSFFLLSNKNETNILSPKYRNIDYFLISKSKNIFSDNITKIINKSDFINGNFLLPVDNNIKKHISEILK